MAEKVLFLTVGSEDRSQILRVFRDAGSELSAEFAAGLEKGLKILKEKDVVAVVVDLSLPEMILTAILRDMSNQKISQPVILLTRDKDEESILRFMHAGAFDCLSKSFGYPELLPVVIGRVLARHEGIKNNIERERLIRKSQKQWMRIIDGITDFIFITDEDYKIIKANSAFAGYFNKHPKELIGRKCNELLGIDIANDHCLAEIHTSDPGRALTFERQINNEIYQVSVFTSIKGFVIYVMKNITETKRLKEHLYYTEKLKSLGLLTGGMAHEINNPLTGIFSYIELLSMKITDESVRRDLGKIYESAERCKRVIENLMTFSRQQVSSRSVESINDIIDRTVDLRAYALRSRNIEVQKEYADAVTVFVDTQQIQQVILNILLNAEQAIASTGRNGGRVVFRTESLAEGKKVRITISDNGPGIPADIIPRIFDPFFTTKPVGVGTGLGLSISYGIISEHGGNITAERAEGGGMTFIIELPTGAGATYVSQVS